MKLNKILFGTFMIATASLMLSCSSKDDDNGGGNNNGGNNGGNTEVKGEMKTAELLGFVTDTDGAPLAGVTVKSGTETTTTDASGSFDFKKIEVVQGRTVVEFKKDGYFDVVRSVTKADKDKWEVVMVSRNNTAITDNATYSSSSSKTLSTDGGMEVKMPANAYKNAETGKDYTGQVTTEMLYLDPDDDNFATMMPGGDLAAVDADNKTVQLVSYGMTKVEMTDNAGNKLQLKDGKEAELTFPIPESMKDETPDQIPLWSFNEKTGLWEEEGLATLQNGVYVGKVKHFSWVNLDWPESRVTVKIKVKTTKGSPVPWIRIHVGQTTCTSNAQGEAQCYIPENTDVRIWVNSEDYGNYSPIVYVDVHGAAGGATIQQTITLPDLPYITGKIVNKEGSALSTVWIAYGGNETKYYHTDLEGKFSILSPTGYTGPATLKIRAANGEYFSKSFTITGQDVDLGEIDINAKIDPTKTQGGTIYVNTDDKKTYELPITISSENKLSGAYIMDNRFHIVDYDQYEKEGDWDNPNFQRTMWSIGSENYDRSKGTAIGYFYYMIEGNQGYTMAEVNETNYEVQINDKQMVLNMNGRGVFRQMGPDGEGYGEDVDWETGNAAFTGAGLTFNIIQIGETRKPFTKNDAPSFMPFIGNSYPIGMVYTGGPYYSKGYEAYSDGTIETFNQLVAQCENSLTGWTKLVDEEDGNDDPEVVFYSATEAKMLTIEFNSWAQWNEEQVANATSADDVYSVPIVVMAVEGLTVSPTDIVNDDNVVRVSRRTAMKKVQAMKNRLTRFFRK